MKNWYKQAQAINMMSFISQWITASYYSPQDANDFMEQANAHSGGMLDPNDLRTSIESAKNQVASTQQGDITEFQNQFIQAVLSSALSDPVSENVDTDIGIDGISDPAIEQDQSLSQI